MGNEGEGEKIIIPTPEACWALGRILARAYNEWGSQPVIKLGHPLKVWLSITLVPIKKGTIPKAIGVGLGLDFSILTYFGRILAL